MEDLEPLSPAIYDPEHLKRKIFEAMEKSLDKAYIQRVASHDRLQMLGIARETVDILCRDLLERGYVGTVPDFTVWWDDSSGGPVAEIILPPGTLTAKFNLG